MPDLKPLVDFFFAIAEDPRISVTHIGIFSALLYYQQERHYENPICVFSYQIMKIAKISASSTYHKCIRELSEYGYIKYEPSFKRNRGSRIYFLKRAQRKNGELNT